MELWMMLHLHNWNIATSSLNPYALGGAINYVAHIHVDDSYLLCGILALY